jgi:hypothetical protein
MKKEMFKCNNHYCSKSNTCKCYILNYFAKKLVLKSEYKNCTHYEEIEITRRSK